ncbi:MAG: ABC transporter ATP-binding protein [Firmicutes bacterium]|nr:ABC transporter ATP-binding protein [Bacillota bacterium]
MFKLFKKPGKKQLVYALICVTFISLNVYLELKIPDYMSEITVLVQTEGSKMIDILKEGGYMLLCAFGSLIASVVVGYFASRVAAYFGKITRKSVFEKVGKFSTEEINKFSTSSLITRTTNDVTQVQMLIAMGLQAMIKAPIMATWAIIKISGKNSSWSIATAVGVVILLITISIIMSLVFPKFKLVQKLTDNLNRITRENLTGIRVIRAFNAEGYQQKKFENANEELKNLQLFNQKTMGFLSPVMSLVSSGLSLAIYFIGAILINEANMLDKLTLFGDMVVFSSYAMQVIMSFMILIMIFIMFPRASISAKRILEVLETNEKITDGDILEGKEKGTVEFKNVSFKYPDAEEYMLKNISFKANKGETIAFIGSTGSGKSTLINLVPRFYDATEGEVLVDGVNVKDYKIEALNNIIGYVPQKAVMFSGTVNENVSYGNNAKGKPSQEKIKEAVKVAQGVDFVEKMENQYDAMIARGGTNISGGQKQRLAIARAIARDPEIYIFDDSFSALDYKTDFILRKELKKYTKDATSLIVAQRVGTIKEADKIFVLDEGNLVGAGTHKELLKSCEIYREIALSQLGEEELENESR